MKRILLAVLVIVVVGGPIILAHRAMRRERAANAEAEKAVSAPPRVELLPDGRTAIHLDTQTQKRIELTTAPVAAATLDPERQAYGRVLDPAPLESLVASFASAGAALDASAKEYRRVKRLHMENNSASARDLEAAEAAMKRDQIAEEAARWRLATDWGQGVTKEPDLPAFVRALATLETVLLRLDLPSGEALLDLPTGARLIVPGVPHPLPARLLGRAPTTDPQAQGSGFLLVLTNAPPSLTPGLAVSGFLQLPGKPLSGATVPNAAVVRSSGHAWVYVQVNETTFRRQEIAAQHPVAGGWFVMAGVTASDRVVTTGAETLLAEELRTRIKLPD